MMRSLRSTRPFLLLAACFVSSTGINAYLIAPASVVPLLIETYGITKTAAGLAVSVPLFGAVLLQLPGGYLMDRYDNRALLFGGTVGFAVATSLGVFAGSYPTWLATRFVAGVCSIFLFTMGAKVIAETFPPGRRGFATTVFTASAPLGVALGQFATPRFATTLGLDPSFVVYAGLSVVGSLLFYLSTPDPIRSDGDIGIETIRRVLTDRNILFMSASAACTYALYFFLNSWMPTYGTEVLSLSLQNAGAIAALVPVMGVLGRPGGGWLSDRLGGRRRPVVAGAIIVVLPVLAAITRAPSLLVFALSLLLIGFVLQFAMGIYFIYVQELAEDGTGGTALAVFGTVGFSGSLLSPILGGWLIETLSWSLAFGVYVLVGIAGIALVTLVVESS
jgi:MFS family permease